ncbi:hypothetical protein [Streptomyces venezuelae]|uniref:hypothetical protein n=1 Tax=Streptomyces venezuelae TaxID=54571 RepID=UPI003326CE48
MRLAQAMRELSRRAFPEPAVVADDALAPIGQARLQRRRQAAATEVAAAAPGPRRTSPGCRAGSRDRCDGCAVATAQIPCVRAQTIRRLRQVGTDRAGFVQRRDFHKVVASQCGMQDSSPMASTKKSVSSRAKRVGKQRAAADLRRRQREYDGVPAEIVELLESEDILPEWDVFYRAFPTVTAAVEAVTRGQEVRLESHEHDLLLLQVVVEDAEPVVMTTLYVPYGTRDALLSGLFNSAPADRDQALATMATVLPELLPDDARIEGVEAVVEPPAVGSPVPRFAYRFRTPAHGLTTWSSYYDATLRLSPLREAVAWIDPRVAADAAAVAILRRRDIPATSCAQCGHAVTNQHPAWPGLWVDFIAEGGPVCENYDDSALARDNELDSLAIGGPHQVLSLEEAEAAGSL